MSNHSGGNSRVMKRLLALSLMLLTAASAPIMPDVMPGLWSVATTARDQVGTRICVTTIDYLAQYDHRSQPCERTIIRGDHDDLLVQYKCRSGDFGRAQIHALTPRSLRIDVQGISGGLPFSNTYFASRIGACPVLKRPALRR